LFNIKRLVFQLYSGGVQVKKYIKPT